MEDLKRSLLKCQLLLEEGKWDALLEELSKVSSFEGLSLDEARECLALLDHLIGQAEEKRNQIAQTLANIRRFKESSY